MKILVNKCPDTGDLFECDTEFKKHRVKINKQKADEKKASEIRNSFFDWLRAEKMKITNPTMIVPWFMENQKTIMEAHNAGVRSKNHHGWGDKFYPETDEFTKFEFRNYRFEYNVSNSHTCPENGVTNWGGKVEGAPTGYPGWSGWVNGTLKRLPKHNSKYPYSDVLNLVGICTGSGGGGNESWNYDVKVFLADWPGLEEWVNEYESEIIVEKLKGRR